VGSVLRTKELGFGISVTGDTADASKLTVGRQRSNGPYCVPSSIGVSSEQLRRKYMTLIAALPCPNAVVLCADSQETSGDYRLTRQKITPEGMGRLGQFSVIIAGSGHSQIIDAFVLGLQERMKGEGTSKIEDFARIVREVLRHVRQEELPYLPDDDRYLEFIVAAVSTERTYGVWITKGSRLKAIINEAIMVGCENSFYTATVRQFYRHGMTVSEAVLAGVNVLTVAESTSNYVRGPFTVAIVDCDGICVEASGIIASIQERLRVFTRIVNGVFLSCADTGLCLNEFTGLLSQFSENALRLHKQHLVGLLMALVTNDRALDFVNHTYARIPPGVSLEILNGDFDDVLLSGQKDVLKQKFTDAYERQNAKLNTRL
jgi:20S proteasome alpha/beta subunit